MEQDPNIPEDLKSEGRALWVWLDAECENIERCRPLAHELCRIADRLQEVRSKIASQGLVVSGARGRSTRNTLLDTELKLAGAYQKFWRQLGLSDKTPDDDPVQERRPVGRPPAGGDKLWQG